MGKYLSKEGVTRLTQKLRSEYRAKRKLWGNEYDGTADVTGPIQAYAIATGYTDVWTDPYGYEHPWYGWDRRFAQRNAYSTTISDWNGITLRTNSASVHLVGASGNVGIGIAGPEAKLHVNGSLKAGNVTCTNLNFIPEGSSTILGGVSVGTSESNFQGAQNSKLWLGWRGGKRAMAFDSSGNANIGPATEVDAAYRLTVEGDLHVKGSVVADTPAPVAAREIPSGTNLNDCDEPGWYVCKGVPSAELTSLPASMGSSSALYFQLLVTPRPYDEDNPPSAASRYVAQVLFQSSRFSFTGIWVRGVGHTAWKKVALENDT